MSFFQAFAAAVPSGDRDAYIDHARRAAFVFRKHGALRIVEGWGADVPQGERTSFPKAVEAGEGETVVLGWVEWRSREACEKGMKLSMEDPQMPGSMPFDGQRLIFGGFDVVVEE